MLSRHGSKVHAVVGLEVDDKELVDRLLKRGRQCRDASDDNLDTITRRLSVIPLPRPPLCATTTRKGGKYHAIPGSGEIDSIFSDIKTRRTPLRKMMTRKIPYSQRRRKYTTALRVRLEAMPLADELTADTMARWQRQQFATTRP